MKSRLLSIFVTVVLLVAAALADPVSGFDEGLRRYRSNDMDGAIAAWEQVIGQGYVSSPMLYNLGNAYYRTGKIGRAILCYERARKLTPRDHDVNANLDLARLGTVDKIEPPVRLMIWNWVDNIRDYLSLSELAVLFYVFGTIGACTLLVWRLGPLKIRNLFRRLAAGALILYFMIGILYIWGVSLYREPGAIIMASKSDAFSAPDSAAKQLFSLHEGTEVHTGESLSGWVNVRLADGRRGWVPIQDIERI